MAKFPPSEIIPIEIVPWQTFHLLYVLHRGLPPGVLEGRSLRGARAAPAQGSAVNACETGWPWLGKSLGSKRGCACARGGAGDSPRHRGSDEGWPEGLTDQGAQPVPSYVFLTASAGFNRLSVNAHPTFLCL